MVDVNMYLQFELQNRLNKTLNLIKNLGLDNYGVAEDECDEYYN